MLSDAITSDLKIIQQGRPDVRVVRVITEDDGAYEGVTPELLSGPDDLELNVLEIRSTVMDQEYRKHVLRYRGKDGHWHAMEEMLSGPDGVDYFQLTAKPGQLGYYVARHGSAQTAPWLRLTK